MSDAATRLARAIRAGIARDAERRGTGRARGTVLDPSPLRVDLHGSSRVLDAQDITLGRSVVAEGITAGDVLVLVEVDDDEWVAVDVESEVV